jgi:hypothetical protein
MGTGHYEHDHQHLEEKSVGVDGRSSAMGARRLRWGRDTIEQADELDKEGALRGEPPRVACLDTRHISKAFRSGRLAGPYIVYDRPSASFTSGGCR